MKRNSIYLSLSILFLVFCSSVNAQDVISYTSSNELNTNASYDSRLLMHYTAEQLDDMKLNSPEEYNGLVYYHTQSYFLEITECFDCVLISPSQFDITQYEDLRHISTTRVFDNVKEGWKLTLIPIDNLEHKLTIHTLRKEYNIDYN